MHKLPGTTASRGLFTVAATLFFVALTGCSMGTLQTSGPVSVVGTGSVSVSGTIHGGTQPIVGATVQIYLAGNTGYGTGATTLGNSAVTGPGGNFTISGINYGTAGAPNDPCSSDAAQAYIVATGGNPGLATGTNNTSIFIAAALGPCNGLSTSTTVQISEVSTAAFAYAFNSYISPGSSSGSTTTGPSVGSPNTAQALVGIKNAYSTYNNLYSNTSGLAVTATTLSNAGASLVATPDFTKLNTVADILASCVQSQGTSDPNSTSCSTLSNSVGSSFAAGGVLAAATYIVRNPTTSTNLYSLVQGTAAPYPALTSQPTDWTLAIQYVDNAGTFLLKPQNVAIDSTGNVWVLSNANIGGTTGYGGLVELMPNGTPMTAVTSLYVDGPNNASGVESSLKTTSTGYYLNPGTLFTSYFNSLNPTIDNTSTPPQLNPRNLAIDTNNNVWFTASSSPTDSTTNVVASGTVFEYTGGTIPSHGFSTGKAAYGLAIDGNNNVFVSQQSSSAYFGMYDFPGGSFTSPLAFPIPSATAGTKGTSGTNNYYAPQYLTVDTSGNLWGTPGTGTNTSLLELTAITNNNVCALTSPQPYCLNMPTTSTTANTFNTVAVSNAVEGFGLSAGNASLYVSNFGSSTAQENNFFAVTGISTANPPAVTSTSYGSATTVGATKATAVDGAGNIWVASANGSTTSGGTVSYGGISEFNASGAALSPSSSTVSVQMPPGFNHANAVANTPGPTCTSNCTSYSNLGLGSVSSVAIDPSGNVWLANNLQQVPATAANGMTAGTPAIPSSVFELVGAAAPTVTPIALALKNGTVATKP